MISNFISLLLVCVCVRRPCGIRHMPGCCGSLQHRSQQAHKQGLAAGWVHSFRRHQLDGASCCNVACGCQIWQPMCPTWSVSHALCDVCNMQLGHAQKMWRSTAVATMTTRSLAVCWCALGGWWQQLQHCSINGSACYVL